MTGSNPPRRPPKAAEALLRAALPDGVVGNSILRDLREEHRTAGWSALRYWREALTLAAHYALDRVRRSAPRTVSPDARPLSMDRLTQNVRYALRRLARNPGFAAVALVTMALGIGANVAIYSVVQAVLLDPLPYEEPSELVAVWESFPERDNFGNVANPGNFHAWRERSETLEDVAAVTMVQPAIFVGGDEPVEITARYASGNYFELLGMRPVVGSLPVVVPQSEGQPQLLLSHRFWSSHFGGDPAVVGRGVRINGLAAVVAGVLPREYVVFGQDADLFAAIPIMGDQTNTGRYLNVVGRLADGVTLETARQEMRSVAAGLEEEYPEFNGGWSVHLVPLQEEVVGDAAAGLWILLGAVGLLLLIACANVANLFLARATERQREMAVRTSLGASGRMLAGQLLVESLVVAGAGAALGVGLAWGGTALLARSAPDAFAVPRLAAAGIDVGVVLFAVALTVVTGLVFGLVPALRAARVDPGATLSAEARGHGRAGGRIRNALVVGEVAVSVVLLAGAGLLARSFVELQRVDPGIETENVLTARVALQGASYSDPATRVRFFGELMDRVGEIPGVEASGAISFLPFTGPGAATTYHAATGPRAPSQEWPVTHVRNVAGDWFRAAGVAVEAGRGLTRADGPDGRAVVVVNRALADATWPGQDPIGRRVILNWRDMEELEVVGVAEDVLHEGMDADAKPTLYLPYAQAPYFPFLNLTVRSSRPSGDVAAALAEAVRALDPGVPVSDVRPMEGIVGASLARPRVTAFLMGVFALLAATLAAVGLYGVLACTVAQRVREIGVRVALGAEPGRVVRLVVGQGMVLVLGGLVAGVAASLLLGPLLDSVLFTVNARDPVSVTGAALLLAVVGALACTVPALRATRVDPAEALRAE